MKSSHGWHKVDSSNWSNQVFCQKIEVIICAHIAKNAIFPPKSGNASKPPSSILLIDWMHCVCLGVVKYIMQLQLSEGNKDKVFFIGASKACLSHKLLSIKPPDIVGRLPRSLEDLKHWKATELKNWLLHYSVAVLHKILNPLYLFHWALLVGGIGILSADSISNDDLRNADDMLQDFVLLMGVLYGPTKCTMNVHLLQHLAYYVSRRGPIWAYM